MMGRAGIDEAVVAASERLLALYQQGQGGGPMQLRERLPALLSPWLQCSDVTWHHGVAMAAGRAPRRQPCPGGAQLQGWHGHGDAGVCFRLFRAAAPFLPHEAEQLGRLLPHLAAVVAINQQLWLAQREAAGEAVALVTGNGQLRCVTQHGQRLLRQEWPAGRVPWRRLLAADGGGYVGHRIKLRLTHLGADWLVQMAICSPLMQLTPREWEIVRCFSQGRSYKVVALEIGLSPATVRNHLTRIYRKLAIHDKGALATLLQGAAGTGAALSVAATLQRLGSGGAKGP